MTKKPKLGRPPKPPGEKAVVRSTSLTPAAVRWLEATYGSVSKGLRKLVADAMTK